jgi:hypothetical protein
MARGPRKKPQWSPDDEQDQEEMQQEVMEQSKVMARRSGENIAALGEISGTLMSGWMELANETTQLMHAVWRHNVEGTSRLMRCRTASEYAQVQSDMMIKVIEEVVHLTHRIADKSKEVAAEAEKRLRTNGHHLRVVASSDR